MNADASASKEFCTNCHVGSLRPHRAAYTRWHDGQFVVMPGMPAWLCDFCGEMFYDDEIMMRLVMLLGPESDLEDQRRWRVTGREENWAAELGDRRRMR